MATQLPHNITVYQHFLSCLSYPKRLLSLESFEKYLKFLAGRLVFGLLLESHHVLLDDQLTIEIVLYILDVLWVFEVACRYYYVR